MTISEIFLSIFILGNVCLKLQQNIFQMLRDKSLEANRIQIISIFINGYVNFVHMLNFGIKRKEVFNSD